MSRSKLALAVVAGAALVWAAAAAADREKIHYTAAGQAAARAAVLKRSDLGAATGWTGGSKKPDVSSAIPGCSYQPKQSDLTLIGAAETDWKHVGVEIDSEAQVLQTPQMVRLDWQRTVLDPRVLPCLRRNLAKETGSSGRFVSFGPIAFPHLATYTRRFRARIDVTAHGQTVPVLVDVIALGRGQTELTLTLIAPAAAAPALTASEPRLARMLLARVKS